MGYLNKFLLISEIWRAILDFCFALATDTWDYWTIPLPFWMNSEVDKSVKASSTQDNEITTFRNFLHVPEVAYITVWEPLLYNDQRKEAFSYCLLYVHYHNYHCLKVPIYTVWLNHIYYVTFIMAKTTNREVCLFGKYNDWRVLADDTKRHVDGSFHRLPIKMSVQRENTMNYWTLLSKSMLVTLYYITLVSLSSYFIKLYCSTIKFNI